MPVRLLLCAALAAGCGSPESMEERIPVEPGGRLEVDLDLGDGLRPDPGSLEVVSHDSDEIRIVAEASGWGASGVRFRVDENGRAVSVQARVEGTFSWMFGGPQIQLRIRVPREFDLDLRCTAAPIRVEDVTGLVRARTGDASIDVVGAEGRLKLRTGDGAIRVSEIAGPVEARAMYGDIEARYVEGDVQARTGGGEIVLSHVDGRVEVRSDRGGIEAEAMRGSLEAKTERGTVSVNFVDAPEGHLETSRGNVYVVIPDGTGADLEAVSRRGDVELGRGLSVEGSGESSEVVGPLNGGGFPLRLYTARGEIHVSRR
jgi:hypothetical protein